MRFSVDEAETTPGSGSTPKKKQQRGGEEQQQQQQTRWVPLQSHPVFSSSSSTPAGPTTTPKNLLAWDGASRIFYWDPPNRCLHRISLRFGDPDFSSVLAAAHSKVLIPDVEVKFEVNRISINRNGSAMIVLGSDDLCVMRLSGRASTRRNATVCRTVSVGLPIYLSESNAIRMLQVLWHPYSDMHLGILSSDSVLRLFNLSADLLESEQEYYLQPVEPGKSRGATSLRPVDFSFGTDHLWDRFSVYVLFADGSVYVLCPIVPFGSVHRWNSLAELFSDAHTFGLESKNPAAVSNSNLAISWLEATFPELDKEAGEGNLRADKARPHALFDASLCLQGPLRKVHQGGEDDEDIANRGAECEGCAVGFLYNLVSKDSILVTTWSSGQLQINALADEVQPVWTIGRPPCIRVDSKDHIVSLAMICECELLTWEADQPPNSSIWSGNPPPLLSLAVVDLALPRKQDGGVHVTPYADPLMRERIYALHEGGIDSVTLHFLPFTSQARGKDESVRPPSVHSILSTCQAESSTPSLSGFVALSDSFGYSWVVGITSTQECLVLEMKTRELLLPFHVDLEKLSSLEVIKEIDVPLIISKELLNGPRTALLPQDSLRHISAESIDGRQLLHQYQRLFHDTYVEYAHKVYFELKHHGPHLKKIIDDQHTRLREAQEKLLKVDKKQVGLDERIDQAIQRKALLEQRLQWLRNLPAVHKKPLSKAEHKFKSELDHISGVELDALHNSVNTLRARMRRHAQYSKSVPVNHQYSKSVPVNHRRNLLHQNKTQDAQVSQLRSVLEKLSLVNEESSKKVKLVEYALKNRESSVL